jgi:hypothetical protein
MSGTTGIILVIGVLAIASYLVVTSTSTSSDSSQFCNGDWTDYFNPLCWTSSLLGGAETELNTILIILAGVAIIVVALLAFSPNGGVIAGHASRAALLT